MKNDYGTKYSPKKTAVDGWRFGLGHERLSML